MTEPGISPSDRREEVMVPPVYALVGAVVLMVFAFFLTKFLEIFYRDMDWRVLAVPAGLIGLVIGAVGGWRWVGQQRLMRQIATEMGFKPVSDKMKEEIRRRIRAVCSDKVSLSNAMGRRLGKARLMIAVMTRDSDTGDSESSSTRQTIAWYESKSLDLPRFTLVPEGRLFRRFAAMAGLRDINFRDSPEFSSSYHLSGDVEGPIRALFASEVRDHFANQDGWQLIGHKSRILMFRPSNVRRPREIREFIRDAVEAFRLLNASEKNVDVYRAEHGPETDEDVLEEFEKNAGPDAKRTVMTSAELKEFLAQPVPRELTPSMKNRCAPDWILRIIGLFFMVGGITFLAISLVGNVDADSRNIMRGPGAFFGVMGGLVMWLAGWSGRRATVLLRNGTPARGRVEDVSETFIVMNNQRRHIAHVRFKFAGTNRHANCNLYGSDVTAALRMASDGRPVNIMVDPQNPYRILLLDTLALTR